MGVSGRWDAFSRGHQFFDRYGLELRKQRSRGCPRRRRKMAQVQGVPDDEVKDDPPWDGTRVDRRWLDRRWLDRR
jgi:hypothetical protein